MASLFISYSRKDIESARKLTEAFKSQDLDFWIDWEGIPPTVDWWKEIEKGIEEADIFLFLLSPDSARSSVCRREIEHAVKNGKRLVPVVVRDVKADESPQELRHLNWIFLRETDDFEPAFSKLIAAVKTDYAWVQAHKQLQVKALEWERSSSETSFLLRGKELQDAELQLVANASKEPHPTGLQREYVLRSRQESDRQRRRTRVIAVGVIIALAVFAIFGFVQARLATANAVKEQAASTLAVSNEKTAVANEAEAKRQASIALARQLAANAQLIFSQQDSRYETAVLLAIQSMRLFPSSDAAQILQNERLARPIERFSFEGPVYNVAVSWNSKYVAMGGCDGPNPDRSCKQGTVLVWDTMLGKEVTRLKHEGAIYGIAFSPDEKHLLSSSSDGTVHVWEIATGREISRMTPDAGSLSTVFSPDGKYVLSAAWEQPARLWDPVTGEDVGLVSHFDSVGSVAFSSDGAYIATGGDDGGHVWETAKGAQIAHIVPVGEGMTLVEGVMTPAVLGVRSVVFSPDGQRLATASDDGVRIWDILTAQEALYIPVQGLARVQSLAFSPDGNYLVAGLGVFNNEAAIVWDANTGEEISRSTHDTSLRFLQGAGGDYGGPPSKRTVAFSPDGKYAISGGCDKRVTNDAECIIGSARVWEIRTGRELGRMMYDQTVDSVAFSPDGKLIISGSRDGTVDLWSMDSIRAIKLLPHEDEVYRLAFSADSNYLVSGGGDSDPTARSWSVGTGKQVAQRMYDTWVNLISPSPVGAYVVSSNGGRLADLWNAGTGEEVFPMSFGAIINSVAFSPDGKYVALGGCHQWDSEKGCVKGAIRLWSALTSDYSEIPIQGQAWTVAFSPDGNYLVSGECDQYVFGVACMASSLVVRDTDTRGEVTRVTQAGSLGTLDISSDSNSVVTAVCEQDVPGTSCSQITVRILELKTGKELLRVSQTGQVNAVKFSRDGKYFATGGEDSAARVWSAVTGEEVLQILFEGSVNSVAFSPDGIYLAAGSQDGTVRVWDIHNRLEILRTAHSGPVASVAVSPNGQYIGSASYDGFARVWLYRPQDLIADACPRLSRNLTRAEWQQYVGELLPYQAVCENLAIEPEGNSTPEK